MVLSKHMGVAVDNAKVTKTDITAGNGVIHVIAGGEYAQVIALDSQNALRSPWGQRIRFFTLQAVIDED